MSRERARRSSWQALPAASRPPPSRCGAIEIPSSCPPLEPPLVASLNPTLLSVARAAALVVSAACATTPDSPHGGSAVRVILVGDSTMASDSGWGDTFCADAAPDVTCLNLGRGGRSSKSYREDGSWARVQKELAKSGAWGHTWVFVQFGHNDAAVDSSKATDFATEFTPTMARYVDEVRAAGATPVLITPLTRRQFRAGLLLDTLSPWAAAVRKLATTRDVPLLDLATDSVIAVQAMGPVASMALAADAPPEALVVAAESGTTGEAMRSGLIPPEDRRFDYTHLGEHGARVFATMVEDELKDAVPELAAHFHTPPPG